MLDLGVNLWEACHCGRKRDSSHIAVSVETLGTRRSEAFGRNTIQSSPSAMGWHDSIKRKCEAMFIKRAINVQNNGYMVDVPDACPICHRHSEIQVLQAEQIDNGAGIQVILRCAYIGCRQFFFCYYGPRPEVELKAVKPSKPESTAFRDAVREISPVFVEIFNEANEAAQLGLKQIAGPGYRKAFEYLIKDYAKSLAPTKVPEIESKFAGAVVAEFIGDARIQAVAKRSLWLGTTRPTIFGSGWTTT
jgi:hypothetical protein